MRASMPAPANLEDSYLLYLAALRDSGVASMFDARVTVDAAIDASRHGKTDVRARWMWAFADRQPQP